MVKRAPVEVLRAGTVHPGQVPGAGRGRGRRRRGGVRRRAARSARRALVDAVFLPNVHRAVVAALRGDAARPATGEALGDRRDRDRRGDDRGGRRRGQGRGRRAAGAAARPTGWAARATCCSTARCRTSRRRSRSPWRGSSDRWRAPARCRAVGSRSARVIPQLHREMRAELEAAPRFASDWVGAAGGEAERVQLARVIGTVVATMKAPNMDGLRLLHRPAADPAPRAGRAARGRRGRASRWPGRASWCSSSGRARRPRRCPNRFVPVDHAIVGIVGRGRRSSRRVKLARVVGHGRVDDQGADLRRAGAAPGATSSSPTGSAVGRLPDRRRHRGRRGRRDRARAGRGRRRRARSWGSRRRAAADGGRGDRRRGRGAGGRRPRSRGTREDASRVAGPGRAGGQARGPARDAPAPGPRVKPARRSASRRRPGRC